MQLHPTSEIAIGRYINRFVPHVIGHGVVPCNDNLLRHCLGGDSINLSDDECRVCPEEWLLRLPRHCDEGK